MRRVLNQAATAVKAKGTIFAIVYRPPTRTRASDRRHRPPAMSSDLEDPPRRRITRSGRQRRSAEGAGAQNDPRICEVSATTSNCFRFHRAARDDCERFSTLIDKRMWPINGVIVAILDGPDASKQATTDTPAGASRSPGCRSRGFSIRAGANGYCDVTKGVTLNDEHSPARRRRRR